MNVKQLLQLVVDSNASDLHLIAGIPPVLRIEGELRNVDNVGVLTMDSVNGFLREILNTEQRGFLPPGKLQ